MKRWLLLGLGLAATSCISNVHPTLSTPTAYGSGYGGSTDRNVLIVAPRGGGPTPGCVPPGITGYDPACTFSRGF